MKMMRNALSAIFDIPDLDLSHLEQKVLNFNITVYRRGGHYCNQQRTTTNVAVALKIILLLLRGGIKI